MRILPNTVAALLLLFVPLQVVAADPDYREWDRLLRVHHDPAKGVDYAALARTERAALSDLRSMMAQVDPGARSHDEELAYWINLYNINLVGIVVDHYPIRSIRDLSTDPIIRTNVFRKRLVPLGNETVSLDFIEHETIRSRFADPRIHFALNCGARSCPPLRGEAYRGDVLSRQLDEQVRSFVNGPRGVRLSRKGAVVTLHTTKIMDWYDEDFAAAGGAVSFLRPYISAAARRVMDSARVVKVRYQGYDWSLNDWQRGGVN